MLNEFRPVGPTGAGHVIKALVLLAIPKSLPFAQRLAGRLSRPECPVTAQAAPVSARFPLHIQPIREDELPRETAHAGGRQCAAHSAG